MRLGDRRVCQIGLPSWLEFARVYIYFLTKGTWVVGLGVGVHVGCGHRAHEFSRVDVQAHGWELRGDEVLGLDHVVFKW